MDWSKGVLIPFKAGHWFKRTAVTGPAPGKR